MSSNNLTDLDQLKQDLIEEIDLRVQDRILEPTNAALLRKLIQQADNTNEALSIAALGTTYKRTGLHFDKRFERMTDSIAYFRRNDTLSFHTDDNQPTHKLIIGDNYEALQNLLVSYRGGIDVIYINPPYGKDSMGEFAQTNYQNAISRDNLLSMLYPRLMLAKQLLSDDGVIFCSIDDKNQAYVKCLFDEVFGEGNFVGCVSCLTNPGGDKKDFMENTLQYILTYGKTKDQLEDLGCSIQQKIKDYTQIDRVGRYRKGGQLEKWGNDDTTHTHPNLAYSIYYNPITHDVQCLFDYNQAEINKDRQLNIQYEQPNSRLTSKGYFCIRPRITNSGENGRWRMEEKTFMQKLQTDEFIFEEQGDGYKIYEKDRYAEYKFVKAKNFIPSDIAKQNTKELRDIFGNKPFAYPKPLSLMRCLVQWYGNPSATVLDFFAGSGTTGHAVLDLNKQDGGNRTFILCQLNEKTDTTPNGIAYDVTAKRLKRIMTGACYDGTTDFKWAQNNTPYGGNLEVVEIDHVANFESHEGKSPFEVIDETLYGKPKFATLREKIEWVCSHFTETQARVENDQEW